MDEIKLYRKVFVNKREPELNSLAFHMTLKQNPHFPEEIMTHEISHSAPLGVVIPAYLEGKNIVSLVKSVREFCPGVQIVVVDDSPDTETVDAVKGMGFDSVNAIHRMKKGGRGSAVIEGVEFLSMKGCQWIVEMDADFSHPPKQIPDLVEEARSKGLDLLIASRYLPESKIINWPISRKIFSKLSNILAKSLLRVPVSDYTNGFRLYSKEAAQIVVSDCGKLGKGFIALSEILVNIYFRGLTVGEVPTVFTNRVRGQSSLNSAEITNAFLGLFKILRLKWKLKDV